MTKKTEQGIAEIAKSGDRLETLIALRDLLALRLQTSDSDRDISSMSRRLMQTIAEIEVLQKEKEALEESGGSLREMRQRLRHVRENMRTTYQLNELEREHEAL